MRLVWYINAKIRNEKAIKHINNHFLSECEGEKSGNDNDARNYVYVLDLETRYYPNIDGFESGVRGGRTSENFSRMIEREASSVENVHSQ